jgi:hypothetical protein
VYQAVLVVVALVAEQMQVAQGHKILAVVVVDLL